MKSKEQQLDERREATMQMYYRAWTSRKRPETVLRPPSNIKAPVPQPAPLPANPDDDQLDLPLAAIKR